MSFDMFRPILDFDLLPLFLTFKTESLLTCSYNGRENRPKISGHWQLSQMPLRRVEPLIICSVRQHILSASRLWNELPYMIKAAVQNIAISRGVYLTIWTMNICPLTIFYKAPLNS